MPIHTDASEPNSPTLRRDTMAGDVMKQQALSTPGAVLGDGGYVYRPADDGTGVTVLHDPTGAATGATLTSGDTFEAVRGELEAKGVMPERPVAVAEFAPTEVTATPSPEGINRAVSNETLGESPGVPSEGISQAVSNETLGESPAQAAATEGLPRDVGPAAVPALGESPSGVAEVAFGAPPEPEPEPAAEGGFNPWKDIAKQLASQQGVELDDAQVEAGGSSGRVTAEPALAPGEIPDDPRDSQFEARQPGESPDATFANPAVADIERKDAAVGAPAESAAPVPESNEALGESAAPPAEGENLSGRLAKIEEALALLVGQAGGGA